ncbi:YggS family pyridoxal phosphate-dependent enzyme [Citromicrobium bathyomarinum]|uniref:YggS family pyridoxal phosphate-dependent enzyme n=1 Tax=Citromicrobium bathyomarinum TaxID=72174 RepID=UPI00315A5E05
MDSAAALGQVEERIARACKIAKRERDEVNLIAVSKTHPVEKIEPVLEAGHRVFGENRVQEAQAKWPDLRARYDEVELHLIGQLQSNKAEDAAATFDVIHSLDRSSLLKALAKAYDKLGKRVPCFIQVDVGEEEQKGGCAIPDLPALIDQAREADIPLLGLMCIPPADKEPAPFFALLDELARRHEPEPGAWALSMGMSADYETAIMLGATHIRVGSALFGERG